MRLDKTPATIYSPPPPVILADPESLEAWLVTVHAMQYAGVEVDPGLLARYILAWRRWLAASRIMASTGGDVLEIRGDLYTNVWAAVVDHAWETLFDLARACGFTPAARRPG